MNNILSVFGQEQLAARANLLMRSNEVSQRYGLVLSDAQITALIKAEGETLRASGRLEFGDGILPRLTYTFCDSPFINRDGYFDILNALQDLFYTYKNELDDALTDDELLEAMRNLYHGKAQGSLEYMENIATADLLKALRSDCSDDDEDPDEDAYDE